MALCVLVRLPLSVSAVKVNCNMETLCQCRVWGVVITGSAVCSSLCYSSSIVLLVCSDVPGLIAYHI